MEKNAAPEKSESFSRTGNHNQNNNNADHVGNQSDTVHLKSHGLQERDRAQSRNSQNSSFGSDWTLAQVLDDVDRFVAALSSPNGESNAQAVEIPDAVEALCKIVDSMINNYDSRGSPTRFGQNQEEDSSFIEALDRISNLINKLGELQRNSNSTGTSFINRASTVLHRAMAFLEDEFRTLLENAKPNHLDPKTPKASKPSTFNAHTESDQSSLSVTEPETESSGDDRLPAFSAEFVENMNKIATAMVSAGYETECYLVYSVFRRNSFNAELNNLGFDNIGMDDVQRMPWESLEGEITTWINVVKHCSSVLFPGERNLCNSVFSKHPLISDRIFKDLAHAVALRLLNFAEAVVLTKRSSEKLFKFLDMYETLRDLIPAINDSYSGEHAEELISEAVAAKSRLGEAAVRIFGELEISIKSDNGKVPVPSGAVHPLTRYTMNYLEYACEYKDTLEEVFKENHKLNSSNGTDGETKLPTEKDDGRGLINTTPFSIQLMSVMDLLDANLEMKSKLYRDMALRYIFLMNNGRYILQKVRGSTEIHEMMGETWRRRRSAELRQYHKNYRGETWGKLLQCLSHDGLQVNGKVSKPILKERFKLFNQTFDEIHKTQSTWVVSDEQLQSELRVSVTAIVIPAYRSFLGRFRQYLDQGRHAERYIKYQPEDIETLIDELFDGNPTSMGRRRT